MRILVVTDAWQPQVNGVVRTLSTLKDELERLGHEPVFITPDQFRHHSLSDLSRDPPVPCGPGGAWRGSSRNQPCAIHISTEGPLGWAARRYCLKRRPALHHRLSHQISRNTSVPAFRVPLPVSYRGDPPLPGAGFDHHGGHRIGQDRAGKCRLRAHPALVARGRHRPYSAPTRMKKSRPCAGAAAIAAAAALYVGRVAVEKNIDAFLGPICPAAKWWSATDRSSRSCDGK